MSLTSDRADGIDVWSGRLLAIAGVVLLVEAVGGLSGESLSGLPFSWLLTTIPFGVGFALAPLVLLRSYRYLDDHAPLSAVVGAAFVAALPVGTVVLVVWGLLGLAVGPVPGIAALPVSVGTVFFALLAAFALGVGTFGLTFLRDGRTRLLGASLLTFASAWALPLAVVRLSGVYPDWLATVLVVTVATAMIAVGHCFPPVGPGRGQ
ncbi:hypothetical protein [Haloarcula litorea]|uniref:hypothetical protein n=1 Tax=Haloarcula litorea TaxID=3032579 RepID=UPI0023E8C794|nr:hypothetical protein [Halomicroarcula sp. GDY20]